jgi:hypothetical protein
MADIEGALRRRIAGTLRDWRDALHQPGWTLARIYIGMIGVILVLSVLYAVLHDTNWATNWFPNVIAEWTGLIIAVTIVDRLVDQARREPMRSRAVTDLADILRETARAFIRMDAPRVEPVSCLPTLLSMIVEISSLAPLGGDDSHLRGPRQYHHGWLRRRPLPPGRHPYLRETRAIAVEVIQPWVNGSTRTFVSDPTFADMAHLRSGWLRLKADRLAMNRSAAAGDPLSRRAAVWMRLVWAGQEKRCDAPARTCYPCGSQAWALMRGEARRRRCAMSAPPSIGRNNETGGPPGPRERA